MPLGGNLEEIMADAEPGDIIYLTEGTHNILFLYFYKKEGYLWLFLSFFDKRYVYQQL